MDPILDTSKKKIIENPVDKILDMIAKANIDRLDLDSSKKKIIENPVDKILDMIAKANIGRLDFGPIIILILYSQMRINIKTISQILTQKPK